jgi:predicted chitinase
MKIDRKQFWKLYRQEFTEYLPQPTVDGANFILDQFERELRLTGIPQFAYVLATAYHESGKVKIIDGRKRMVRFQPVRETRGKSNSTLWLKYQSRYWNTGFYGRGLVQITWEKNYSKLGIALGKGSLFVQNPDLVLEPFWAYEILVVGMTKGLFTAHKLSDHINARKKDYKEARRIVNGQDKAREIAEIANKFEAILKDSLIKNSAAANIVPAGNTAGVTTDDSSRETPIENQPTAEANQTQTETTQNAENITNVNTAPPSAVPPDFVPEDKPIAAPVKEGTTTTATTVTIAGLVVPPALVGIVQAVQSAFEKGYIDAKQVFDAVLNLLTNNLRYVPYLIGLIVLILIIKKVFKQVSFLLQMYLTASPDKNNPIIVPTVPETSKLTLAQRLTGRI